MRHARRRRFPWVWVYSIALVVVAVGLFWLYIDYISGMVAEE